MLREFLLADHDTIHIPPAVTGRQMAPKRVRSQANLQIGKGASRRGFEELSRTSSAKTSSNIVGRADLGTDRSALNKLAKKHGFVGERFHRLRADPPPVRFLTWVNFHLWVKNVSLDDAIFSFHYPIARGG